MIPYSPVYQGAAKVRRAGFPPIPSPTQPVTIVLALHNGARYLSEQLNSIAQQTHRNWSLIIHDDASRDTGATMAAAFASTLPNRDITVARRAEWLGASQTFLRLISAAPPGAIAFADQDDVWLPTKLSRAMEALSRIPERVPALYCSRTIVCDAALNRKRLSPGFRRPPSFGNALVQNIAAGNTIVLNPMAARIMRAGAATRADVVAHDWYCYQLITGAGGQVIFDQKPGLYYRQHAQNHVGANHGPLARAQRLAAVAQGQLTAWADANVRALNAVLPLLTPNNRRTLAAFEAARTLPPWRRLEALRRLGVYRQTRATDAVLRLAALTGKL